MTLAKRIHKFLITILKALLAVVTCYVVSAGICAFIVSNGELTSAPRTQRIFVASNGVHLNLILPTKSTQWDWVAKLNNANLAITPYIYLGWGSQAFYTQVPTWDDLTAELTAKALLFDDSVVLIQGGYAPQLGNFRTINVTESQLQQLSADIFTQMQSQTPLPIAKKYAFANFYPAKGKYSPLMTCNEWIRVRLHNIGLPTPLWSPFDRPILWALPK